jgi:hypothetical protein
VFGLRMLAVKKSRSRSDALLPASAISRGTSIADAAARRTIAVGTMIASAWLGSVVGLSEPTADVTMPSASTVADAIKKGRGTIRRMTQRTQTLRKTSVALKLVTIAAVHSRALPEPPLRCSARVDQRGKRIGVFGSCGNFGYESQGELAARRPTRQHEGYSVAKLPSAPDKLPDRRCFRLGRRT